MSSMKCKTCGLVNFETDDVCRRCANPVFETGKRADKPPRRFSVMPILLIVIAGGAAYYLYSGSGSAPTAIGNVNISTTTAPDSPGLSRTEYDRARAAQYKNAVANSNSFTQSQKHNEDLQRAMQQASNSSQ